MSGTVIADDGTRLPVAELPMTLQYSGNNVTSFTVEYPNQNGVDTQYVQTLTYAGDNVIAISRWVAQ